VKMKNLSLILLVFILLVDCYLANEAIKDDAYVYKPLRYDYSKITGNPEIKNKIDKFFNRIVKARTHTSKTIFIH
jgi:hypothetical protein